MWIPCLIATALVAQPAPTAASTVKFEAPKYGVTATLPSGWQIAQREQEDRVFVALIPQSDPDRPGVAACELGLAPQSLDEYRTRIDANAKQGRRPGGTLVKNEVIKTPKGERLETHWEFRPRSGGLWRERAVRLVANRQLYTLTLNVDDKTYATAGKLFDALLDSLTLKAPDTGADRVGKAGNRWLQREFQFAIDLPDDWSPVLAPAEVALLFANGPAQGIWSDNLLVIAEPHRKLDLKRLEADLPEQLRAAEPNCEVLSCKVVPQGKGQALETVVRTQRGPFSMTILERRFAADRLDFEVKYTVESKRFDALAPTLRESLDGFQELPSTAPVKKGTGKDA